RVRTCDNHCEFCFIYQLPKGMRRSLYLKDDDYRLSFLYGNFTTLTRFTEADLERVVEQRLSPLYVSIHSTDPELRSSMLRNKRGAISLRWLRLLLDAGIEVHGQVVVCPGVNDAAALADTLAGILDLYPELATVAVVPLGISRFSNESAMRAHSLEEARAVVGLVADFQEVFLATVSRRMVYASDEYYLLAKRPFPEAQYYDGFPQHENGIGMARAFERELMENVDVSGGVKSGFFQWVEGAPAEGYRAPRRASGAVPLKVTRRAGRGLPVTVLTGEYGARVLRPLLDQAGYSEVELLAVRNDFFGGNIAVTGLIAGSDVSRVLASAPAEGRYLLPDVCLSKGVFLDGMAVEELPREVEVVKTDGVSLKRALGAPRPVAA
ncbi:MAG: DUF512 domain-containing protein, partial [Acidimicrobiales bacterium]